MDICIVGCGYVGLVSGACFAEFGWSVACVDTDAGRIGDLNRGIVPIYEPGLEDLIARGVAGHRLFFTTDLGAAVAPADVVFLAVGTPMRRGSGHADLSFVRQAVKELAPHLAGYTVIATKSTVPVGTSREIESVLRSVNPKADFSVCSNPEFLREGSAIRDFTHPDRVLVGADDERAMAVLERLYKPLALRNAPVMFVGRESAELAKYAANAFLAMKISFINEIADLCEAAGGDVQEVASAIGSDGRIGDKFLHPGPGYGGSCFPKDIAALIETGRIKGAPLSLVEQVAEVNAGRKKKMAERITAALGGTVAGLTISVLGVTFKPGTDDMREAPSLDIIPALQQAGARIRAYDPHGMESAAALIADVAWCGDAFEAADGADGVVVLTEWNEFRAVDLGALARRMAGNVLIDLRNMFSPEDAVAAGLVYHGVGRKPAWPERASRASVIAG